MLDDSVLRFHARLSCFTFSWVWLELTLGNDVPPRDDLVQQRPQCLVPERGDLLVGSLDYLWQTLNAGT